MKNKLFPVPFTLFLVTAFSAIIANSLSMSLFRYLLLASSMVYLFSGWYIFKGYMPEAQTAMLFLYGYAYSSIIGALAFSAFSWPMMNTFLWIGLFWTAIILILTFTQRLMLERKSIIQVVSETLVMILLLFYHLWFAPHLPPGV